LGLLLVWPFTEAGRFLIPLVPFVLVGAVETLTMFGKRAGLRRARAWAAGVLLAVSLPYAAYAIATGRARAQRQTYRDFDNACAWIYRESTRAGQVFSLIRRQSVSPTSDDPLENDRLISRFGVAYLVIDDDRYVNASASPLRRYVDHFPGRVRRVWSSPGAAPSVSVYEILPQR
jgi:hypothetical protein